MKSKPNKKFRAAAFKAVRDVGLSLPGVELSTRYDGLPVLKINGVFVAALATHHSAEPGTLVVRMSVDERDWILADAPDIYYVTEYYRKYPVVLARLSGIDRSALYDLLSVSRRLALAKTRPTRSSVSI